MRLGDGGRRASVKQRRRSGHAGRRRGWATFAGAAQGRATLRDGGKAPGVKAAVVSRLPDA